jgi:hypothetical protein
LYSLKKEPTSRRRQQKNSSKTFCFLFFFFLCGSSSSSSYSSHHHFYDIYRKLPLLLLILCFLSGFLFLAKCKCKKKNNHANNLLYNNWRCILDDTKEDQSSVTGTQSMYVLSKIKKDDESVNRYYIYPKTFDLEHKH